MKKNLRKLRRQIDCIDKELISLLNNRAKVAWQIGKIKNIHGESPYSPERETEVINKATSLNKGPLTSSALESIYREIMSFSLSALGPLKVAYLGPKASFTHLAALKKFGSQVDFDASNSISDVFLKVEKGTADYGVIPIENSIEGAVSHSLDMFVDSDAKICSEITLDISHNLLANCGRNKIRRIYSNPQVFGQCRLWLQENIPCAEQVEVSSTTRAAQIAKKEKNSACIASLLAAKVYGLNVLAKEIEDSPHNFTRFLVIGNTLVPPSQDTKTSLMFSIKDKVGALHDMLVPFKKYRINLTKIESRPSKKKAWDYYFFVDLEGHYKDKRVKKAVRELENKCTFLKVLGSYPIGE